VSDKSLPTAQDAPGTADPGERGQRDRIQVRSTHRAEGRMLSNKSPLRVQQGGAALPSLGQPPGCQGSHKSQADGRRVGPVSTYRTRRVGVHGKPSPQTLTNSFPKARHTRAGGKHHPIMGGKHWAAIDKQLVQQGHYPIWPTSLPPRIANPLEMLPQALRRRAFSHLVITQPRSKPQSTHNLKLEKAQVNVRVLKNGSHIIMSCWALAKDFRFL
jgi:hypothetical protein